MYENSGKWPRLALMVFLGILWGLMAEKICGGKILGLKIKV